jgi:hypothetical protein
VKTTRQFGHVTRQQLLELDLPSQTIARWVENGYLTVRTTWTRLTEDAANEAESLRRTLARRHAGSS